jgi:hypothetical protein
MRRRRRDRINCGWGPVAELADAHGLGPCGETRVGSTPIRPTTLWHILAHFSGHGMARFTSVYFPSKQEITSVYKDFLNIPHILQLARSRRDILWA